MAGQHLGRTLPRSEQYAGWIRTNGSGRDISSQRLWLVRYRGKRLGMVQQIGIDQAMRRRYHATRPARSRAMIPTNQAFPNAYSAGIVPVQRSILHALPSRRTREGSPR